MQEYLDIKSNSISHESTSRQQFHKLFQTKEVLPVQKGQKEVNLTIGASSNKRTTNLENGHRIKLLFQRIKQMKNVYYITLTMNMLLGISYYELDFEQNQLSSLILLLVFLTGVVSIILLALSKIAKCELLEERKSDYFWKPVMRFFLQIVIILICPLPWLDAVQIPCYLAGEDHSLYQFKLNYILTLLSFSKIFIISEAYYYNSKYCTPQSMRLCKMNSIVADYLYCLKCFFKDSPVKFLVIVFISNVCWFSIAFRIVERSASPDQNYYFFFQNCVWATLIAICGVGFGDITPQTQIGYFLDYVCIIWGSLNTSSMVVVLIHVLRLNTNQKKSLAILNKTEQSKETKHIAALYLKSALWRVYKNYKKYQIKKQKLKPFTLVPLTGEARQSLVEKKLRRLFSERIRLEKTNDLTVNGEYKFIESNLEYAIHTCESLAENNLKILTFIADNYFHFTEDSSLSKEKK